MSQPTVIMTKLYVADTHVLLWHLFDPSRLGPTAREALQEVDNNEAILNLPVVVIAEALMVIEKSASKSQKANLKRLCIR